MLLDRNRVAKLVELTAWERSLRGPERMIREEDVALLIKAAYADATEESRAAFMAKVSKYPTSAWPWSSVQAVPMTPARGGGGTMDIAANPVPVVPSTPALLILIRGQAESADADPGNRLPSRGAVEAAEWEPLHKALDAWDTAALLRWVGPQGWISPAGATAGAPKQDTPSADPTGGSSGLPAPQSSPPVPLWQQPGVIAAGAVAVVATGVTIYALTRPSDKDRLEAELLRRQQEGTR